LTSGDGDGDGISDDAVNCPARQRRCLGGHWDQIGGRCGWTCQPGDLQPPVNNTTKYNIFIL